MYLAAFSGCVLFSYNSILKGSVGGNGSNSSDRSLNKLLRLGKALSSSSPANNDSSGLRVTRQVELEDGRRLSADDYIQKRVR